MSKWKLALGVAATALSVYMAAAPYITVHQMNDAAKRRDGEALSEHIDIPSVRQSLKDQMNAMFAKEMLEDEELKDNAFATFGMAIAGLMVERMVDAYVIPAGIAVLMAGEKPQLDMDEDGERIDSSGREHLSDASMSYESFDKFVVIAKSTDGGEGKFVLRRRGFGWKLTDIVIPLD